MANFVYTSLQMIGRFCQSVLSLHFMNLKTLESQLKKRWKLPYYEDNLRIDIWQDQTEFVCAIEDLEEVQNQFFHRFNGHKRFEDFKNYAINRWYNHLSSKAIQDIFESHTRVRVLKSQVTGQPMMYIEAIPYTLRIVDFNQVFMQDLAAVKKNRSEFAKGLMQHSGIDSSVIYLVLSSTEAITSRMRCELTWLKERIDAYLDEFDKKNITRVNRGGHISFADLLIVHL